MLKMYKVGCGPVTTVVWGYSGEYVMPHWFIKFNGPSSWSRISLFGWKQALILENAGKFSWGGSYISKFQQ